MNLKKLGSVLLFMLAFIAGCKEQEKSLFDSKNGGQSEFLTTSPAAPAYAPKSPEISSFGFADQTDYTNSVSIHLRLVGKNITHFMVSKDYTFQEAQWEPYLGDDIVWVDTSTDSYKRVYLRVKNADNAKEILEQSFLYKYDIKGPVIQVYAPGMSQTIGKSNKTLIRINIDDMLTFVENFYTKVEIRKKVYATTTWSDWQTLAMTPKTDDPKTLEKWLDLVPNLDLSKNEYEIRVTAKDVLGNETQYSSNFYHDPNFADLTFSFSCPRTESTSPYRCVWLKGDHVSMTLNVPKDLQNAVTSETIVLDSYPSHLILSDTKSFLGSLHLDAPIADGVFSAHANLTINGTSYSVFATNPLRIDSQVQYSFGTIDLSKTYLGNSNLTVPIYPTGGDSKLYVYVSYSYDNGQTFNSPSEQIQQIVSANYPFRLFIPNKEGSIKLKFAIRDEFGFSDEKLVGPINVSPNKEFWIGTNLSNYDVVVLKNGNLSIVYKSNVNGCLKEMILPSDILSENLTNISSVGGSYYYDCNINNVSDSGFEVWREDRYRAAFDTAGLCLQDPTLRPCPVSALPSGTFFTTRTPPTSAVLSNGNTATVYVSGSVAFIDIKNPTGALIKSAIRVSSGLDVSSNRTRPGVVTLGNNGFEVFWMSTQGFPTSSGGIPYYLYKKAFSNEGTEL